VRRGWVLPLYGALALGVAGLGAYLAVALFVEHGVEVAVPTVTGLTLSEALDETAPLGLDLEILAFEYSDQVPENHILRQRPVAQRVVKSGRAVSVVLSRGPERHPAPDVRGLPQEDARILLGEAGLTESAGPQVHSGPAGRVVAMGVDPGTRLPRGAALPLVISAGTRPVRLRMPRLEGQTMDQALTSLDHHGLRATRVEEVSLEDPNRRGRVVSQDPLPGFPVAVGEGVVLSVAGTVGSAALVRGIWMSRAVPPGFGRHRVELQVEDGEQSWTAAAEWLPAGSVFRRWLLLRPGQRARLSIDGKNVPFGE
jgi:serine/threonine-protein kinase